MKEPKLPEILSRKGYGQLIFLSCIERPKNRREIAEDWGLSIKAKLLYRPGVEASIKNLITDGLLEKMKNGKLSSTFKGIPAIIKASKEEIKFIRFMNKPLLRKELAQEILSIENIKKYFNYDLDLARKQALLPIIHLSSAVSFYEEALEGKIPPKSLVHFLVQVSVDGGFNFCFYHKTYDKATRRMKSENLLKKLEGTL